jgi:hypothetical protein
MGWYGEGMGQQDFERRAGQMSQFAGIQRSVLAEGRGRGSEIAHVRTGSGLQYFVHCSRGMDIGMAEWCGIPLAWVSQVGHASPEFYEPANRDWLRTFYGGLLTTCGLRSFGPPAERDGEVFGQHGRISHIPAENISVSTEWVNGRYVMSITGQMREVRVFGENLLLTRRITSWLGENRIQLEDTVHNAGFRTEGHMILYHFNLGFPLMDRHTVLQIPSRSVMARDEGVSAEKADAFGAPAPGQTEEVFFRDTEPDENGTVTVGVWNPLLRHPGGQGLGLRLTYDKRQLPWLTQWKMPGEGTYVLGLEPCNTLVSKGPVPLEPGEKRTYSITVSVDTERRV